MEALKIAFDAIVVGSSALPWVAMLGYLFLGEARVSKAWQRMRDSLPQIPATLGTVLLFVVAYLLGSAVSRVSGDFFNDEDLRIPITEDSIRASVYCAKSEDLQLARDAAWQLSLPSEVMKDCHPSATIEEQCKSDVRMLFQLQEGALILKGTDKNER